MEHGREGEHEGTPPPADLATLKRGTVLCDRHRKECYQVTDVDTAGVALHQDGTTFYVPYSLFVTWYSQRLFPIEEARSIQPPEWCQQHHHPNDHEAGADPEEFEVIDTVAD